MATLVRSNLALLCLSLTTILATVSAQTTELPNEKPLWPWPGFKSPIYYDAGESVRTNPPSQGSLSGFNRVYSFVAIPTYSIHQPPANTVNGVGLVICPGGGFRDVWLDREGHDLALWLKPKGVTCLVLKYRTNGEVEGNRQFAPGVYQPAVLADAREAIRVLRSQAGVLHLDPKKIGICGFSAGGNLAFNTVFQPDGDAGAGQISVEPDFAGLFYPGLREDVGQAINDVKRIPPLFLINATDDRTTPATRLVDLYQALIKTGAHPEMHLFAKGGHGFDLGEGRGESAPLWKENFYTWLKDTGFIH
jgi:acetyl esterase/lipase